MEFLATLLRFAAPVGLAALGETVGQRAGLINIGLEGTMLTSSYVTFVVTQVTGSPVLGLIAGVLAGVVLSMAQALFTVRLGCDQVVTGTAINLIAMGLTGTLFRGRFGASGQLVSIAKVGRFGSGFDWVSLSWIVLSIAVTWILYRTRWGLVVRATGEYPPAVEAAGYSPSRMRMQASLAAGAMAGLAGAYLSVGIAGSFAENMTVGRGFVALAMVTFGRWKPLGVLAASVLVGLAESLQLVLQTRNVGLPPQFLIGMPYVLALAVLIAVGKGTTVPEALGQPYRRSK